MFLSLFIDMVVCFCVDVWFRFGNISVVVKNIFKLVLMGLNVWVRFKWCVVFFWFFIVMM